MGAHINRTVDLSKVVKREIQTFLVLFINMYFCFYFFLLFTASSQLFHSDPWSSCLVFLLLFCDSHLDFWPSHGSGKRKRESLFLSLKPVGFMQN